MLRTYRIGVLLLVGLAGLVLLFALFATPASAATSIPRTEIVKRLCDRQEALGSRLRTPLISPSLCGETPPPTPEPTVTLTANPTSVTPGPGSATSTLTWSSTNATSCTAFGGWSGARPTNGSEIVTPGVTTTYQLDCTGPGGVGSDDATVQFVPSPSSPTLTLVKIVVNDGGGAADADDFQARIDGANVSWGVAHTVTVGAHTASEVQVAGYVAGSWGGDCAANGTVTLEAGENKTCTITNNDQQGTLHVVKVVTNDNGGTATTANFSFAVNGLATTTFEVDGQNDLTLDAGTYTVTETATSTYATTYDNCTNVVLPIGGSATCTITNNDIAAEPVAPKLTVTKVVVNDDEGTKVIADFPLFVDGVGVVSGAQNTSTIGAHTVSEANQTGYTAVIGGDCATDGTITLAAGDVKSCTITNNDQQGTLH
ncbi:MAG: hypothetical protein Q8R25_03850, partial [bacterium]|nr:hypothetical protein [bacterium]